MLAWYKMKKLIIIFLLFIAIVTSSVAYWHFLNLRHFKIDLPTFLLIDLPFILTLLSILYVLLGTLRPNLKISFPSIQLPTKILLIAINSALILYQMFIGMSLLFSFSEFKKNPDPIFYFSLLVGFLCSANFLFQLTAPRENHAS